jgi:DNA-binding MarR family transcriptional regulator
MAQVAEQHPSATNRISARTSRKQDSADVPSGLSRAQAQSLAEFRFQLRRFLHFSSAAAEESGLRPQQYQLLQCVWGMPDGLDPTIANVAARMLLKHNSAVELVDRTIEQGLLRRVPDATDHRRILLRVTPQGERLLNSLAAYHLEEIEQAGPELIRALRKVLLMKGEASGEVRGSRKA